MQGLMRRKRQKDVSTCLWLHTSFFLFTYFTQSNGISLQHVQKILPWQESVGLSVQDCCFEGYTDLVGFSIIDDPNSEKIIITVNGTKKREWEPSNHPCNNVDKAEHSQRSLQYSMS
jgi:hypothetical protein